MSFIDMEITRRAFAARYAVVRRSYLALLARDHGVDLYLAEHWADQIDRENEQLSAASHPAASPGGAQLSGAVCTSGVLGAPDFSQSHPVGSRRGSGAAAPPSSAAAPAPSPRS